MPHTLSNHLTQLFRAKHINCVIDVGANVGQYAQMLRNSGYRGRIFSIEPVQSTFDTLQRARPGDHNWRKMRCALGTEHGQLQLNVCAASTGSSFLTPTPGSIPWDNDWELQVDHVEEVTVFTLDEIFDDCTKGIPEPRVHLKLDTQGWDVRVVEGGEQSMERIATMQSELSFQPTYDGMTDWRKALSLYESYGFAVTGLFPIGRDHLLRMHEMDAVLTRI